MLQTLAHVEGKYLGLCYGTTSECSSGRSGGWEKLGFSHNSLLPGRDLNTQHG
jgi:hypothetical protein